jgi:hypothetical protein
VRLRAPDPFRPGSFFDFDPRTALGNCARVDCPVCTRIVEMLEELERASTVKGFDLAD